MSGNNVNLIKSITVNVARYFIEEEFNLNINYRLVGLDLPIKSPTFLHIAIYNSDEVLFDYCMENRADISISLERIGSPLHLAVYKSDNNLDILKKLIQAGANLHVVEYLRDWSPLHAACYSGKYEAAKVLIENGADVNIIGRNHINYPLLDVSTPLYLAIKKNHNNIVELLCRHHAHLEINSCNLGRPLFFAAVNGHCNIVSTLLKFGADVNAFSTIYAVRHRREYKLTSLHAVVGRQNHEMVKVLLMNQKICVNLSVPEFQTPLHCAVVLNSETIVSSLLDFGGNINVLSINGKSLIEYCLEKNPHDDIKLRIIEVLRHHILKLQYIRWNISDKNMDEVRDPEYRPYRKQCIEEVNMMLQDRIGVGKINVYNLLDSSKNLSDSLKGFNGERIFSEEFKSRYPLFSGLVQYRLLRYLQSHGNFSN